MPQETKQRQIITFITKDISTQCKYSFTRMYTYKVFGFDFYLQKISKDGGINFEENVTWVKLLVNKGTFNWKYICKK